MTVQQLIDILKTKSPGAIVKFAYDGPDAYSHVPVTSVEDERGETEVILE